MARVLVQPSRLWSLADRLMYRCQEDENGCWRWLGARSYDGYGHVRRSGGGVAMAHRASYETFVGPVPDGLSLDHLCRVRDCIRPSHLEPVSSLENTRRSPIAPASLNAAKTHCVNGHEFTPENTLPQGGVEAKGRWRRCLECKRAKGREHMRRKYWEQKGATT